jgi:hypothetical protein
MASRKIGKAEGLFMCADWGLANLGANTERMNPTFS